MSSCGRERCASAAAEVAQLLRRKSRDSEGCPLNALDTH